LHWSRLETSVSEQPPLKNCYEEILGIPQTWKAVKVEKDGAAKEVKAAPEYKAETYICPACGKPAKLYDPG
jgi:hypothetical protein